MKKLTLLLLLMVSTSVLAEWTTVGGGTDLISYIDFGTIKRKDNKVKMWSLIDLKTVHEFSGGERYLSGMMRSEYDCEEETMRMLDVYYYSENMREGEVVVSNTNITNEATSVRPDSIEETFFKIACDKK